MKKRNQELLRSQSSLGPEPLQYTYGIHRCQQRINKAYSSGGIWIFSSQWDASDVYVFGGMRNGVLGTTKSICTLLVFLSAGVYVEDETKASGEHTVAASTVTRLNGASLVFQQLTFQRAPKFKPCAFENLHECASRRSRFHPFCIAPSCVAVWQNGRVEICANDQGNRITPSFVAWTPDGQRLVGDSAKNQVSHIVEDEGSTLARVKPCKNGMLLCSTIGTNRRTVFFSAP